MTPDRYPLGATLVFVDANATVSDDSTVAARGVVNGPPLLDEDGVVFLVPVFVAWDHGREATTVYVHVTNVLGVE